MPTHAIIKTNQPELVAVYQQTVELTDAQIKALPVTSIQIVAAPGAGKMIHYISGQLTSDTTEGEYANIHADAIIGFDAGYAVSNTIDENPSSKVSALLQYGDPATVPQLTAITTPVVDEVNTLENKPLKLVFNNNGADDLTGGNAANTLKVTVIYAIVDL